MASISVSKPDEQQFAAFRGWRTALRILVTLISGVATFYFVLRVRGAFIFSADLWAMDRCLGFRSGCIAVVRYVWIYTASFRLGLVRSVVLGAVTTGGIAFSAGFFGPMIFAPGANQGPLLGIFITGPLGLLAGAIGGAIYWFVRRRRADSGQ